MIPSIARLVDSIDHQWAGRNYDEREFSGIAVRALEEARLGEALTISDLVSWFNRERRVAPQVNLEGSFGEPPLTLGATSRFYVEALFWIDGTTTIHQHRFSGAFMVLKGSSIHARYRFERAQRVNGITEIGAIALESAEYLRPGQVRAIRSGPAMIHSLFHLDRPTVSIVARTMTDHDAGPQLDYWPPCIARDPSAIDGRLMRQLQLIRALGRVASPDRFRLARELLEVVDFGSALPILDAVTAANPAAWDEVQDLIGLVHARHPEVDCDLVPVFAERLRQGHLLARRQRMHDPELRLFLAVLLNLPTQAACIEFVRTFAPDRDPADLISSWVDRIGADESTPAEVSLLLQPLLA